MKPLVIVIPVVVILAGVVLFGALRRRDTGGATGALSRETKLRDKGNAALEGELATVSGRQVSKIRVGNVDEVLAKISANKGFLYSAEGRMWMTAYPKSAVDKAKAVYPAPVLPSLEAGVAVLYQKCPHLGCRVPECKTSQWFECPCHGSQYNRNGEKKGGPAPRGMDRFPGSLDPRGNLVINTGQIVQGPPIGTNTTGQEAEGPHCIGSVGGHGA